MIRKLLLFAAAVLTLCSSADSPYAYKPYPRLTKANWLWSGTAKDVPLQAYLRRVITIDEPVKKAYFYSYWDRGGAFYFNGKKLSLKPWKDLPPTFGHVRGRGVDLKPLLKKGKNVLAVTLKRIPPFCYGLMLRGEIVFASGKKITLLSSRTQFKASGKLEKNWNLPSFDDSKWLPAHEQGGVLLKPWSTYGDVSKIYADPEEHQAVLKFLKAGFPAAALAKESNAFSAKIVYKNHIPGIRVNKKLIPPVVIPVCHTISPDRDKLAELVDKAGVRIFSLPLNVFETSPNYLEHIDLSVHRLLAIAPNAYVLFSFREIAPAAWMKKNPDEAIGFALTSPSKKYHDYFGTPFAQSLASDKFLKLMDERLAAFAKFCKSKPWYKRVLGIKNSHGASGDGIPAGAHCMPDTGKRMTEKFRAFLKNKYKTDAALQKSWGDKKVTLKTASVPNAQERWGSKMYLRSPGNPKDRRVLDYYTCYQQVFNNYTLSLMKSIKTHLPGRLAGCFSGYILLGYNNEGSTACFERLLKSPYVDFMWATTRGYNLSDGQHRHLHSVFHRYKKLSSIEADIRTHIDSRGALKWKCRTPEETRATMSKVVANSVFYGTGYHLNGFGRSNIYVLPEIIEPIATGVKFWKKLWAEPPRKGADIAVIIDPEQVWKQGHPIYGKTTQLNNTLITYPLQSLNFSGFAYDMLGYEDFLNSKHSYKCVVFLNAFSVPPVLRKALHKKIRKPGVTAIWHYAPGLVTDKGFSDQSMKELTGIGLKALVFPRYLLALTREKKQMAPLKYRMKDYPTVFSPDKNAEFLGTYSDKRTAFCRKKLADGSTAVFSGIPICYADIWSKLFTDAGCHKYTKPGFMVKSNADNMLQVFSIANGIIAPECVLHNDQVDRAGKVTVRLKKKSGRVRDVFTGKTFKITNSTITLVNTNNRPQCWLLIEE